MEFNIKVYPDNFLRKKGFNIEKIDDEIIRILNAMRDILYHYSGIGLAARQIGLEHNIFIIDLRPEEKSEILEMINPVIISSEGIYDEHKEGCLSVPGYYDIIKTRKKGIRIKYLDREGNENVLDTDEFLSIVIQHELDHLNGLLFIDRLSFLKREIFKKQWKKMLLERKKNA